MARVGTRFYRSITASALRLYLELDRGVVQGTFDSDLANYTIDVQLALKQLQPQEQKVILAVHRDGLTAKDAVRLAGVTHTRPDEYVTAIEVRLGRELQRRKLDDILSYIVR